MQKRNWKSSRIGVNANSAALSPKPFTNRFRQCRVPFSAEFGSAEKLFCCQRRTLAYPRFFLTTRVCGPDGRAHGSAGREVVRERPAWPAARHERRRIRDLEPRRTGGTSLYAARRCGSRRSRRIAALSRKQRHELSHDGLLDLASVGPLERFERLE